MSVPPPCDGPGVPSRPPLPVDAGTGWRLIVPPDRWQAPIPVEEALLAPLEELAARLALAFHRDDARRKVYVGLPRPEGPGEPPGPEGPGLVVPVPGATSSSNGAYSGDTGLDIVVPVGSPVVAASSGTILYSERGHTPWTTPPDTPNSVLIALDRPVPYRGREYGLLWYTHLGRLRFRVADGSGRGSHVSRGELVGWSGIGNRVPHVHMGLVGDRPQTVFVPPEQLAAWLGWTGGERR